MEKGVNKMTPKIDKVMVVKSIGMLMTIGGMIASQWSGKKETDKALEKLVTEKLQTK